MARFLWEFKFKLKFLRYRKLPVKLEISFNFCYYFGTYYMLHCLHVHATDFILVSIFAHFLLRFVF